MYRLDLDCPPVLLRAAISLALLSCPQLVSAQVHRPTSEMPGRGATIVANSNSVTFTESSASLASWLGLGFQSSRQVLLDHCLAGSPSLGGNREAHLLTTYNGSFADFSSETTGRLNVGVSVFGLFGGSAEIEYFGRVATTDLSASVNLEFDATLGAVTLLNPAYTGVATEAIRGAPEDWRTHCGDSFVSTIRVGSRLALGLVFHLATREERDRFVKTLRVKVLGFTVGKKRWTEETSSFDRNSRVEIVALQMGGHPQRLLDLWRSAQSLCRFDDPEPCLLLWNSLMNYAQSPSGYRAQFHWPYALDDLALLDFRTERYLDSDFDALAPAGEPVPIGISLTMKRLLELRAQVFSTLVRVRLLLASSGESARATQLNALLASLVRELDSLDLELAGCQLQTSERICTQALAAARARFALLQTVDLSF